MNGPDASPPDVHDLLLGAGSEARLVMKEGLVCRVIDEDFVIYDPEYDQIAVLNGPVAVVLDRCQQGDNLAAAIRFLADRLDRSPADLAPDIREGLRQLLRQGFLIAADRGGGV